MSSKRLYLSFILAAAAPRCSVVAQVQNAQFNQVINLNGDMQINRLAFPDKSMIETFSQKQNQVIVNQNPNPLPASHVVGSTGQPFVQLSTTSTTISTNGATDLVGGQIELPIDPAILSQNNVSPDNTFVAKLSDDRQVWVIMEGLKTVNTTDNTVRMIKLNNIDGEYLAVGRQTAETSNVLTTFGGDQQSTVSVTGSGIQELEFVDGFRMSIMATQPMTVNTDVVNGISSSMMPDNSMMAVNNYRYLVTTSLAGVVANLNQMTAVVQLPVSADRIMRMAMSMGAGPSDSIALGIAQRPVLLNPGGAVGGALAGQSQQKRRAASSGLAGKGTTRASKPTGSRGGASDPVTSDAACEGSSANAGADVDDDPDTDISTACASSEATATVSASSDASSASADSSASTTASAGTSSSASAESTSAATDNSSAIANSTSATASSASSAANSTSTANSGAAQGASNTQLQGAAATQLLLAPTFTPLTGRAVFDVNAGRLAIPVSQLDGEFILTMSKSGAAQGTQPQPQQGQAPAPQQSQSRPASPAPTQTESPSPAAASQGAVTPGAAESVTVVAQQASGVPQAATKRQAPTQQVATAGGQNTVVISMAELSDLVQRQKTGGVIPVWQMMAEFKAQQAQSGSQIETPLRAKKRSGPVRGVAWKA